MRFADVIKLYLDKTNCTAKELSAASGISASALSRYRSGKRIPEQEQIEKLICGFVQLASENAPELNEAVIRNDFSAYTEKPKLDYQTIIKNLNAAIEALDISVSGLSRALSFDSSYLSRIRAGQRKPADLNKFITETAGYIARTNSPLAIAGLIGCPVEELVPVGRCASKLCSWLSSGTISHRDYLGELLHQLDTFNIETYMSGALFPEAIQVRESETLSLPKYYYGFDEMKKGELDFFRTVASSGTKGTVCMCNSIPIEDLSADAAYMREWMRAVAMMIMKGADIQIIHDVDRPSGEMLLGLMSWIPLYMTGKVTSFYLTDSSSHIYCHTDYVSDTAVLFGECIRGFHSEGKYCLTQSETDLVYYKKRAQRLFSKTKPLIKTYRSESKAEFFSFEDSEVLSGGTRRNILSSLPTYTIPGDTLESMLENNSFGEKDKADVRNYISRQKRIAETILENGTICDEISELSEEEFGKEPVYLSLSGMFSEKDLRYTYQEYLQHLAATKQFAADHTGYDLHMDISRRKGVIKMIGRQVIKTNRAFSLEELEQFMQENWDKEQYNHFIIGRPTAASVEKYILLPATARFMVIAYARKAGGLFNKENKVILSVCDTPKGVEQDIFRSIHSHNVFFGAWKIAKTMSMEEERKGPAEEILQKYAEYMKQLLDGAGYSK